jgi:NADH-quinone oxidoreductase subunit M
VAGIVYGALVALAQSDMKRLIAYSSVSHLGYCMLGLFALNPAGIEGSVLQLINHGLSTGALFALVGMLYERYHTRQISAVGGLARRLPRLSALLLLFTFSSIGLPGLNGFAGEFLILLGMFQRAQSVGPAEAWAFQALAALAVLGVVLGAWYMLYLVQRVCFGPLREPPHDHDAPPVRDLSARELLALAPLAVLVIWIGVAPRFFLDRSSATLLPLTRGAAAAWDQRAADAPQNKVARVHPHR